MKRMPLSSIVAPPHSSRASSTETRPRVFCSPRNHGGASARLGSDSSVGSPIFLPLSSEIRRQDHCFRPAGSLHEKASPPGMFAGGKRTRNRTCILLIINLLYSRKFTYGWKKISIRIKINFFPYRNKFSCGKKFCSDRMQIYGDTYAARTRSGNEHRTQPFFDCLIFST